VKGHPEVLPPAQQEALRIVAGPLTAHGFYLGGGTAVAIHLGHRRSLDFDWFSATPLTDPLTLAAQLKRDGVPMDVADIGRGTLHGTVASIRMTLLEYPYAHLSPPVDWMAFGCRIASLDDLGTMKLSAIAGRGSRKDFVDLYALGTAHHPLKEMVGAYRTRFAVTDTAHLLYALAYFDDAEDEPMPEVLWDVDWSTIRQTIEGWVRAGL
jgi:hypothetical protein